MADKPPDVEHHLAKLTNDHDAAVSIPQPSDFSGPLRKLHYFLALTRVVAAHENVGVAVILTEFVFLYVTRRIGASMYFKMRLWQRQLPLRDKMRYLNHRQYKKRSNELNDPRCENLSLNKLVEKALLNLLGIPTARFIAFYHPSQGGDRLSQGISDAQELAAILAEQNTSRICFKILESWGGRGFVAAEIVKEGASLGLRNLGDADDVLSVTEFLATYYPDTPPVELLIEEYLQQHEILSILNPSSLNTLRFWVKQSGKTACVIGAVLRMGRQGSVTDNTAQGGLIAIVDLNTGVLGPVIYPEIIPRYVACHPDTGAVVENVHLPWWPECMELALHTLQLFPGTGFAGLDVAITEYGPLLVELNVPPDEVSARNFGPTADLLK